MKILNYICVILFLLTSNTFAKTWEIDRENSKIEFSGSYNKKNFTGRFENFMGQIEFDPNNLNKSFAKIKVDLKSARIGDKTYDGTLPQDDWLNSNKNQFAIFETTKISKIQGDQYKVEGFVTIRNNKVPHNFDATIKIVQNKAVMTAKSKLKRLNFGIGKASDNTGSWVSLEIPLNIEIQAIAKN